MFAGACFPYRKPGSQLAPTLLRTRTISICVKCCAVRSWQHWNLIEYVVFADSQSSVADLSSSTASKLNRKESYKAQRQNYRREKKRVASELLNSLQDPAVIVLADWLKVSV